MTRHDLKRFALGAALGLLALPVQAQQSDATHWVSDSITTYVRSGPTDGYRIIGTLTAGEPVTRLETSGDYSRVQNGRSEERRVGKECRARWWRASTKERDRV